MTIAPGLHAKTGLRFDWAKFNEVVSALEIGVKVNVYCLAALSFAFVVDARISASRPRPVDLHLVYPRRSSRPPKNASFALA